MEVKFMVRGRFRGRGRGYGGSASRSRSKYSAKSTGGFRSPGMQKTYRLERGRGKTHKQARRSTNYLWNESVA